MIHINEDITSSDSEDDYSDDDSMASMPSLVHRDDFDSDSDSEDEYSSDDDSMASMPYLILREDTNSSSDEDEEINKITPSKSIKKKTKGAEILITIPAIGRRPKKTLLALVDIGTSASLIDHDQTSKHVTNKDKKRTAWSTQGGDFKTFAKGNLEKLQLPQFATRRIFHINFTSSRKKLIGTTPSLAASFNKPSVWTS